MRICLVMSVLVVAPAIGLATPFFVWVVDVGAKGTVTLNDSVIRGNTVTVTGKRTATAGWEVGGVGVSATKEAGGRVHFAEVRYERDKPAEWTATFDKMPNGTFTIYATHAVGSGPGQPPDMQLVGSPLSTAIVGLEGNPAEDGAGGTLQFEAGWPKRLQGGTAVGAAGSF